MNRRRVEAVGEVDGSICVRSHTLISLVRTTNYIGGDGHDDLTHTQRALRGPNRGRGDARRRRAVARRLRGRRARPHRARARAARRRPHRSPAPGRRTGSRRFTSPRSSDTPRRPLSCSSAAPIPATLSRHEFVKVTPLHSAVAARRSRGHAHRRGSCWSGERPSTPARKEAARHSIPPPSTATRRSCGRFSTAEPIRMPPRTTGRRRSISAREQRHEAVLELAASAESRSS